MLRFEYDVSNKKMLVFGDKTRKENTFTVNIDLTSWCINYLRNYVYREVSALVKSRESVFIYIGDVTLNERCMKLQQKCERVYNAADWLERYLNVLLIDLDSIAPKSGSRYYKNFYEKRNDLIAVLRHFQTTKPMYKKVNIATQEKLGLFN